MASRKYTNKALVCRPEMTWFGGGSLNGRPSSCAWQNHVCGKGWWWESFLFEAGEKLFQGKIMQLRPFMTNGKSKFLLFCSLVTMPAMAKTFYV